MKNVFEELRAGIPYHILDKEIHICKNAWLGSRVSVMSGVTIGEGAIVASGAVVTEPAQPHGAKT